MMTAAIRALLSKCALAAALLVAMAGTAQAGAVEVQVLGVRRAVGVVRVALCGRSSFLKPDCAYNAEARARAPATTVTFADVAPGRYAAQVFQDEHNDGRVHRNFLGVPTEPIGFSNNAPLFLHGPSFRDAAFEVGPDGARVSLRLRRLAGSR